MTGEPPDDTHGSNPPVLGGNGSPARPRRRWVRRAVVAIVAVLVVSVVSGLIYVRTTPFGASPSGDRQAAIEQSPEWHDGEFTDPQPQWISWWDALTVSAFNSSDLSSPDPALTVAATDTSVLAAPPTAGLRLTWFGHVSTPARHSSGRDPLRTNETLWSGWAMLGPVHRVWYSGDSGYFPDLAEIGKRLAPFDVTLIESGQYDPNWVDNHLGPELAVQANALVGGELMVPVHWGLFNLAPHTWTEPVERVRAEAECRDQAYLVLVPGVPTEPTADNVATQQQWWPSLPWRTAEEVALNPTANGDPDQRVDITPCVLGGS